MCPRINKEIHGELDHSGLTKRALRSSTIDSQSGVDRELPDPPSVLKQMGARSQTRLSFDGARLRCGYLVPSQEVHARLDQVTIPGIDNAEASSNNAPGTETGRQGRRRSRPLAKPLANEAACAPIRVWPRPRRQLFRPSRPESVSADKKINFPVGAVAGPLQRNPLDGIP